MLSVVNQVLLNLNYHLTTGFMKWFLVCFDFFFRVVSLQNLNTYNVWRGFLFD